MKTELEKVKLPSLVLIKLEERKWENKTSFVFKLKFDVK